MEASFDLSWNECLCPLFQDTGGSEKEAVGANDGGNSAVDSGQGLEEEGEGGDNNHEAVPEKLQDDDEMRDPLYKRVFFKIFPQLRRGVCTFIVL